MATRAKTFLLCHGAWSGGWAWKKMHPLMAQAGHRLMTPTYTGLGERAHLASPAIDLDTHIQDILNVIKYEDLATSCCSATAMAAWSRPVSPTAPASASRN